MSKNNINVKQKKKVKLHISLKGFKTLLEIIKLIKELLG